MEGRYLVPFHWWPLVRRALLGGVLVSWLMLQRMQCPARPANRPPPAPDLQASPPALIGYFSLKDGRPFKG